MPAKKTAKKVAKKAAKKAAKKTAKKVPGKHAHHPEGHQLRRAYEHLGRLEVLQGGLPGPTVTQINDLTELARQSLQSGETQAAADLLRACEHLAFAALATAGKETHIGDDLQNAIDTEYEHLIERAVEHWDEQDEEPTGKVAVLYEKTFDAAETAYHKGSFRRALELARGAEALSHVHIAALLLPEGAPQHKLKG